MADWNLAERYKDEDAWGMVQGGCVIWIARVEYGSLDKGLGDVTNEVEMLLMEVRNDINSKKLHAFIQM